MATYPGAQELSLLVNFHHKTCSLHQMVNRIALHLSTNSTSMAWIHPKTLVHGILAVPNGLYIFAYHVAPRTKWRQKKVIQTAPFQSTTSTFRKLLSSTSSAISIDLMTCKALPMSGTMRQSVLRNANAKNPMTRRKNIGKKTVLFVTKYVRAFRSLDPTSGPIVFSTRVQHKFKIMSRLASRTFSI